MRRTLLVFGFALVMTTMLAEDALARRGGGGGGGGGGRGGRGGYGRGGYGGYGYGGYGDGFGYGYGGGLFGGALLGGGYYGGSGYYNDSPGYYYPDSVGQYQQPDMRQSFYSGPSASMQGVMVRVLVPTPDAQVCFNGALTTQQGTQRVFSSPPLEQGYSYTYTIKARWMENGKTVDRERQINVQSGQTPTVDFRTNTGERLATPKSVPNQ